MKRIEGADLKKGDTFVCRCFGKEKSFGVLIQLAKRDYWDNNAYCIVSASLEDDKSLDTSLSFADLVEKSKKLFPDIPYPIDAILTKAAITFRESLKESVGATHKESTFTAKIIKFSDTKEKFPVISWDYYQKKTTEKLETSTLPTTKKIKEKAKPTPDEQKKHRDNKTE